MADSDRLTELGLSVTDTEAGPEAVLQLGTPLLNPLVRRPIATGVFALAEERLIPLEPAELEGLPPLSLEGVRSRSELEQQLAGAFHTHLVTLQRRSAELRTLGFAPQVDPETLELAARVDDPPFRFLLVGDKRGQLAGSRGEPRGRDVRRRRGLAVRPLRLPQPCGAFRPPTGPPRSATPSRGRREAHRTGRAPGGLPRVAGTLRRGSVDSRPGRHRRGREPAGSGHGVPFRRRARARTDVSGAAGGARTGRCGRTNSSSTPSLGWQPLLAVALGISASGWRWSLLGRMGERHSPRRAVRGRARRLPAHAHGSTTSEPGRQRRTSRRCFRTRPGALRHRHHRVARGPGSRR